MRFGSVCSGIEAASVAWAPLGWKAAWLAEIEKFPAAVLAHHYPEVPNLGDMTALPARIASGEVEAPDIFCGGTPCQAFSVAGLRKSLDDARGNLSLVFCEIANAIDTARAVCGRPPAVIFWENVPGVLSTKDNAFGCFLAGLAGENDPLEPPGGKWTNAGCVSGPQRTVAWRVLDAQYFGVAQRRRRVFVVASARKGFDPATVLFEWDGVRRDSAPSREARQTAPTIPARSTAGGGLGTDFDCDGGLIPALSQCTTTGTGQRYDPETETILPVTHSLRGEGFDASEDGTGRGTPLVPHVVGALACNTGPNGHDAGNFACNQAVDAGHVLPVAFAENSRHELRIEGGDGQRTGALSTGGGKPGQGVPMFLHTNKGRPDGRRSAHTEMVSVKDIVETLTTDGHAQSAVAVPVAYGIRTANTSSNGWGIQEECTHTLDCAQGVAVAQPVAFHPTQDPISSTDGSTHALGCGSTGGQASVAVAVALRGREGGATAELGDEVQNCLRASGGGGDKPHVLHAMQVRRLTPVECEKLQGFEPGYTAIPWRGKPADQCPDGPRYKALGNSWAVPNVRWIGERIQRHLAGDL